MSKLFIVLRVIRNIVIAFISAAWVWPLCGSGMLALFFLEKQEAELLNDSSFSSCAESQRLLGMAVGLVIPVIVFWAFVTANKLWPLKGKEKIAIKKSD